MGELKSRVTGFGARWEDLKPKGVPSGDSALMLIKMQDYGKQLADLQVSLLTKQFHCTAMCPDNCQTSLQALPSLGWALIPQVNPCVPVEWSMTTIKPLCYEAPTALNARSCKEQD